MSSTSRAVSFLYSQALEEPGAFLTPKLDEASLIKDNGFFLDASLWCNAIRRLTAKQIGITDPIVLAKFKAALVLEVYAVFLRKEKTYHALREPFLTLEADKNKLMKVTLGSGWISGEELSDTYLQKEQTEYADVATNLYAVYEELFSPVDSGIARGSSKAFQDYYNQVKQLEVKAYLGTASVAERKSLRDLKSQYDAKMHSALISAKQVLGANIFNAQYVPQKTEEKRGGIDHFEKLPETLKGTVSNLILQVNLNLQKQKTDFQHLTSKINKIVDSNSFRFDDYYQNALKALISANDAYMVNSIIEKMLQQEYDPMTKQKTVSDTMSYLAKDGKNAAEELTRLDIVNKLKAIVNDVYPLHAILIQAAAIVSISNEELSKNSEALAAWVVLSSDEEHVENPTQTLVSLSENLNYLKNKPAPEFVSATAVKRLMKELPFQAAYHDAFKNYGTGTVDNCFDRESRSDAQVVFYNHLDEVTTIEQISALFTVAHDYINRPEPGSFSGLLGKTHRYTWRHCMDAAREKALSLLNQNIASVSLHELRLWKNTPLFAEHKGDVTNFGETDSQRAIEKLIVAKENKRKVRLQEIKK